jgi:DNA polymerase bacteriophage-type
MSISIDFETKSRVDLPTEGLDNYVSDPSTDLLCMAYSVDDKLVSVWKPGQPFPSRLREAIDSGEDIYAWNAGFESAVWNKIAAERYDFPYLPIERFHCTMAMALTQGYPGSLEKAAEAMKLGIKKDMSGKRVMMTLSKPRSNGEFWTVDTAHEKFDRLYFYCMDDVAVEIQAKKKLKPLSPQERKVWLADHKINNRGIGIDIDSVRTAQKIIEDEKKRLDGEMRTISEGKIASCSAVSQIANFVGSESVDKSSIQSLLSTNLSETARKVLELRQEAGKSSTAKLSAMIERAGKDGRVRNTLQYYGAGTGRWAGRGIQLQNLPRNTIKQEQIDRAFTLFSQPNAAELISMLIGSPTSVISDCIRGFIQASPGKILRVVDWANIEGRILAWLAGETWKIKAFEEFDKGIGADLYVLSYAKSFDLFTAEVTKDQRQIGKVTELSMGYQGGVGAFQSMAKNYGIEITDGKANEIKNAWRKAHPAVVKLWYAVEEVAITAVRFPGNTFSVNDKIKFHFDGEYLMCRLPSSRILYYPNPKIVQDLKFNKPTLTYEGEDSYTRKWTDLKFYGGYGVENITQAVAADILRDALLRLEERNYPVVAHVHDEIICEMDEGTGSVGEMEKIMCELPKWANGLPLAAEGFESRRYRK